jgi:hypothetical protein
LEGLWYRTPHFERLSGIVALAFVPLQMSFVTCEDANMAFEDEEWQRTTRRRIQTAPEPCVTLDALPLQTLNKILVGAVMGKTIPLEDPSLLTGMVYNVLSSPFSFRVPDDKVHADADAASRELATQMLNRFHEYDRESEILDIRLEVKYSTAADVLRAVQAVGSAEAGSHDDVRDTLTAVCKGLKNQRLSDAIVSVSRAELQARMKIDSYMENRNIPYTLGDNQEFDLDGLLPCFATLSALRLTCKAFSEASRLIKSPPRYGVRLACTLSSLVLNHRDRCNAKLGRSPSSDLDLYWNWDNISNSRHVEPRYSDAMRDFLWQSNSLVATGPVVSDMPRNARSCCAELMRDGRLAPFASVGESKRRLEEWTSMFHYWPKSCINDDCVWNVMMNACRRSIAVPRRARESCAARNNSSADRLTAAFNIAIAKMERKYKESALLTHCNELIAADGNKANYKPLTATRVMLLRNPNFWTNEPWCSSEKDPGDCASPPISVTRGPGAETKSLEPDKSTAAMTAFMLLLSQTFCPRLSLLKELRLTFRIFSRLTWLDSKARWRTIPKIIRRFCTMHMDALDARSGVDRLRCWVQEDEEDEEENSDDSMDQKNDAASEQFVDRIWKKIITGLANISDTMAVAITAYRDNVPEAEPKTLQECTPLMGLKHGTSWYEYFHCKGKMSSCISTKAANALKFMMRTGMLPADDDFQATRLSWHSVVVSVMQDSGVFLPLANDPNQMPEEALDELSARICPFQPIMETLAEHRIWRYFDQFICMLLRYHGVVGARQCVRLANWFIELQRMRNPMSAAEMAALRDRWQQFFDHRQLAQTLAWTGVVRMTRKPKTYKSAKSKALTSLRTLWKQQTIDDADGDR